MTLYGPNGRHFGIFNSFLCQFIDSKMLRISYKMGSVSLTIISCLAATTRKCISKKWEKVFSNTVFEFK